MSPPAHAAAADLTAGHPPASTPAVVHRVASTRFALGRLAEFEPPLALASAARARSLDGRGQQGTDLQAVPYGQPTSRGALEQSRPQVRIPPDQKPPVEVARQLLNAVCEVLDGHRPLRQVGHLLSLRVQEAIRTRVRGGSVVRLTLRLRSVRTCCPAPGVIEASATLTCGNRVRAAAARIEEHGGSWRCTALRVL